MEILERIIGTYKSDFGFAKGEMYIGKLNSQIHIEASYTSMGVMHQRVRFISEIDSNIDLMLELNNEEYLLKLIYENEKLAGSCKFNEHEIQVSLEKIKDTYEFSKPYIEIPKQYLDLLNKYNHYTKEETSINLKYELNNNKVLSYLDEIGISVENRHNLETIKELLKQLCLKIKHDGVNYWHGGKYGTINTFEFALAQNSFTNCRGLAIIFCGILRAYGFKSSYVTCMPYDINDTECHVVCEVYVEELKKFIFIDPSYQVYFTHKNKILNLIEFRECIKNNEDITYYEGASYNGQGFDLLSYLGYFSKNIFYFAKCIDNCEDKESTKDNSVCLVPRGCKERIKYEYTHILSNINDYYQL